MATQSFITEAAQDLLDRSPDRMDVGDPETIERYYSPNEAEEIVCTTDEREDFEQWAEIALTADVIDHQRDYDQFVRFLSDEYGLKKE